MVIGKFKNAVAAEYKRLRKLLLSLLHTWFAQEYLLASGAEEHTLPNPEFYSHINTKRFTHNPEDALIHLKKAEQLLSSLNWNVREDLAIMEFCCSFTA